MSKREDEEIKEDIESKNEYIKEKKRKQEEDRQRELEESIAQKVYEKMSEGAGNYLKNKKERFTLNPIKLTSMSVEAIIKTPGRYISYRPNKMTKEATGVEYSNFINKRKWKEALKTYRTVEYDKDFETSIEVEGISEENLLKKYNIFQTVMVLFIVAMVVMCLPFFSILFSAIDKDFGFIRMVMTLYPFFVIAGILTFFYVYYAWLSFRIRNKWLVNHHKFLRIALKDKDQLMPFNEAEWLEEIVNGNVESKKDETVANFGANKTKSKKKKSSSDTTTGGKNKSTKTGTKKKKTTESKPKKKKETE